RQQVQCPWIVRTRIERLATGGLGAAEVAFACKGVRLLQHSPNAIDQRLARYCPLGVHAVTQLRKTPIILVGAAPRSRRAGIGVPPEGLEWREVKTCALRALNEKVPVFVNVEGLVEATAFIEQAPRDDRGRQ